MRYRETAVAMTAVAAFGLAGCGNESDAPGQNFGPQPSVGQKACTPGYDNGFDGDILPADSMQVVYYGNSGNKELNERQMAVGSTVVSVALAYHYCVAVGDTDYTVSLGIPSSFDARMQNVVFVRHSTQAGQIFKEQGVSELEETTASATDYALGGASSDGHLVLNETALSVVGQEPDGAIENVASQRCEALEMTASPSLTSDKEKLYRIIKHAICRALGRVASLAHRGEPYSDYLAENPDATVSPSATTPHRAVKEPIIPQEQYTLLLAALENS
jgi:hypothetical protein